MPNTPSPTTDRQARMAQFLAGYFAKPYQITALAGDASFRRYYRIESDGDSYLLMDAPPDKESVQSFVAVAELFAAVVNVPDILKRDITNGLLLLQDFGLVEFITLIKQGDHAHSDHSYQRAFLTLKQLQQLPLAHSAGVLAEYSAQILADEMTLFAQWFLSYVGLSIDESLWQQLKQTVIDDVLAQPQVVVHRDYHSRNLMQDKHSDRLGVIDFQDALIGAYSYDVVSLLRDAYIDADELWVQTQLAHCFMQLECQQRFGKSLAEFVHDVNVMGVQRHLKVLGIFVRLFVRDGKRRYLANISKVLTDLQAELTQLSAEGSAPVYGHFLAWLHGVLPNINRQLTRLTQQKTKAIR